MKVLKISKLQGHKLEAQPQPSYTSFSQKVTQYAFFSTAGLMFTEGPENKSLLRNGGKIRRGEHIIDH